MTTKYRFWGYFHALEIPFAALVLCLAFLPRPAWAQSETASVSGRITDQSGGIVPGVDVTIRNLDTGIAQTTKTDATGIYIFPALEPGHYVMNVRKIQFKSVTVTGITLLVQENLSRNFALQVGSLSESVTVSGSGASMNTTNGTVSTVVNRDFVENIPLNGRSLQTLLMLTPGVQMYNGGGLSSSQGQFEVNGQRTDANYFTIDGVAANLGTDEVGNGLPEAAAGSIAGWNALGGTNGLISVDAVQEFRVQTSTFAPEYGRTPGAQVSIVSRAGTNAWHGTAFEYLRNDKLDANDWFANKDGLPKAEERQNDFGGVFGGPVDIPGVYNGHDRTFFFFSYEGLRLREPVTEQSAVPDAASRTAAPSALQPFLNAFPIANGPELTDNLAQFNASVSNPGSIDAYSIRLDHSLTSKVKLFARYDDSPSFIATAGGAGNNPYQVNINTHTFTLGADALVTNTISNQFRANYSNLKSYSTEYLTNLGGAVPLTTAQLGAVMSPEANPATAQFTLQIADGSYYFIGPAGVSEQRQLDFVDNVGMDRGPHQWKFGVDFRYLAPFNNNFPYYLGAYFNGMNGPGGVLTGQTADTSVTSYFSSSIRAKNFSLYGQDTWTVNPRLSLTYGLRWDVNPAPYGANKGSDPYVVQGLNDPTTMTLAPHGTPFYATTWGNVAPRLGIAYQLRNGPGWETVLRGGFGIFYDIGAGGLGEFTLGYPFSASNDLGPATFPAPVAELAPPTVSVSPPYGYLHVAEPGLSLPRTYEWNVAVEQALGPNQTFSVTYLGALGRDLLRSLFLFPSNPDFTFLNVTNNQGNSDYQALQLKFQRQATRGLQVLASYTYSHSIDNASDDQFTYNPFSLGGGTTDRASSSFDIRHSASGAVVYALPSPARNGFAHAVLGGWSADDLLIARTALPVDLTPFDISTIIGGYSISSRPDVVPGVPFYLYGSQYPGGKAFNPAAFTNPAPGTNGDLGRNALRGFGYWQDNFAIHRQFNLTERLNLQFRAEAFNVFNHPSFADPFGFWPISFPLFGLSSESIASASSFNGQNSLYGVGAPRSWQFGLRLAF